MARLLGKPLELVIASEKTGKLWKTGKALFFLFEA